jgi:hypothetical protein
LSCLCTKTLNPGHNARNLLQPSCGFDLLWFERKIYSASIITLIDVEDEGGGWVQYLDENKQLILAILDNQNLGKLNECAT